MNCTECKSKINDSIDIFDNQNTQYVCPHCKTKFVISNSYNRIGGLIPVIILTIDSIIKSRLDLNQIEIYVVNPIIVTVLVFITYSIFIGLYPKKLKKVIQNVSNTAL